MLLPAPFASCVWHVALGEPNVLEVNGTKRTAVADVQHAYW